MPQNPPPLPEEKISPARSARHEALRAEARQAARKMSLFGIIIWSLIGVLLFAAFCALGTWQVQRLHWKEDLIARADARIHLSAVAAPAKAQWPHLSFEQDEYRPVFIKGRFLHDKEILVSASVLLNILDERSGAGYWVMTPLAAPDGAIIFINRGFVPLDKAEQSARAQNLPQGEVEIKGLLRMSEGAGSLFNKNDPKNHIWYSRQLSALAAADNLPPADIAPYFIDADKQAGGEIWPRGGLTTVHFSNNHLVYAITWFCGALGVLIAAAAIIRSARKDSRDERKTKRLS